MKQIKLIETRLTNSQAQADFLLNYRREFLRLVGDRKEKQKKARA